MSLSIYCTGCNIKVMVLIEGSTIKKGAVVLCANCETKRKMSDLSQKTNKGNKFGGDIFDEIFGGSR